MFISSPYGDEAHYARKRATQWVVYKVHVTETCDDDCPHLITNVETTAGPTDDGAVTPRIHQALKEHELLPTTHIVDTGFLDAELLVASREKYGVELLGPARGDHHWQAQADEGFAAQHVQIDQERQQATCPAGRTSLSWTPAIDNRTNAVIKITFSSTDCRRCPHLAQCCRSQKRYPRRTITVRPQAWHEAVLAARERQETASFAAAYCEVDGRPAGRLTPHSGTSPVVSTPTSDPEGFIAKLSGKSSASGILKTIVMSDRASRAASHTACATRGGFSAPPGCVVLCCAMRLANGSMTL